MSDVRCLTELLLY